MKTLRPSRSGFSLTEVLMATGILGVGMTMVASVFPVAIDQSRLSRDATMAALAARSVAAGMRAMRSEVTEQCRNGDGRTQTVLLGKAALPLELRIFNPDTFVYGDDARAYPGLNNLDDLWEHGRYVPVVFATPMDSDMNGGDAEGPWRIAIAVYKSRGTAPGVSLETWGQGNTGGAGDFVLDRKSGTGSSYRGGEVYKLSHLDNAEPECAVPSRSSTGGYEQYVPLRRDDGIVAVYHTILGD